MLFRLIRRYPALSDWRDKDGSLFQALQRLSKKQTKNKKNKLISKREREWRQVAIDMVGEQLANGGLASKFVVSVVCGTCFS